MTSRFDSPDVDPTHAAAGEQAGDRIERYELVEELGEGGMGTVWRARQTEPVTREVALKVIKLGMDTREVVLRFEAERQALARMDHPHIAKVLDGGATRTGRPYFVMELVRGEPITAYCARAQLGLEERLRLFVQVCDGIQHAHQKGLIHRDVKPSNVLVEEREGQAAPKVIDFGIAKATGAEVAQQTMLTQHAQILGTPEYMAPEQAEAGGIDIDTRADVYSLGVLLYELLTGTKPFDLRSVLDQGYGELLRTIREVDPERPSTRVTVSGEAATSHATGLQVDPHTLARGLSQDLDWVVMKAIEKDRERRYHSVSELAADVERYLNREPVIAAPPSGLYRLKKFVQRRKKTVLAATALVLLFLTGSIGTGVGLWQAVQANAALDLSLAEEGRQRELAQDNERRAREAGDEALAEAERATLAEAQASARARELEQVAGFQVAQLRDLDPARMGALLREALLEEVPDEQRAAVAHGLAGVNFTDLALGSLEANLFDGTLEAIEARFGDQPVVRASLLGAMARTLRLLGLHRSALEPQVRALALQREHLGDEHPDTLGTICSMAVLQSALGDSAAAVALFEEAVAGRRRVLGDEHPDTLAAIGSLAAVHFGHGNYSVVEDLYREVLDTSRRVHGADDRETLVALSNMAGLKRDMGQFAEAEALYEEALEGKRRALGDDDPSTITTMTAAAGLYRRQGNHERAEALMREALEARRHQLGEDHPDTLSARGLLAIVLHEGGRTEEALQLERETLAARRRILGPDHLDTLSSLGTIAVILVRLGRLEESEPLLLQVLDGKRRILGDGHTSTLSSMNNLGALYLKQGRHPEAELLLHEALVGRWQVLGREHPRSKTSSDSLHGILAELRAEAESSADEVRLGLVLAHHGALRLVAGEPAAAESLLRRADEVLSGALPESDARLWHTRSDLGAALAAQGRDEEARALLEPAAEWMVEHAEPDAPRPDLHAGPGATTHAAVVQRVVEFHEARHGARPDAGFGAQAASWRERLASWGE